MDFQPSILGTMQVPTNARLNRTSSDFFRSQAEGPWTEARLNSDFFSKLGPVMPSTWVYPSATLCRFYLNAVPVLLEPLPLE